jgi:hypothetical protein
VGLQYRWFSVAAEGRFDPPAGATVATGATVTSARYAGALLPCGHIGWFAGCAVAQIGQIGGSVAAAASVTPDHQAGLYYAMGIRLGAEIPVVSSRLYVRFAADLLGARPAAFRLDGMPQWTTATFVGGLGAGLVAKFW